MQPSTCAPERNLLIKGLSLACSSVWEYYDFVVYGLMMPYIAQVFFPHEGYFGVAFVFSIGYFGRGVGALFFSFITDAYGKKKALIFALNLMGVSTCCIGMIPAYRNIGDLSTFLLCVFRFCQGLSFAGELPTAALFIQKLYPKTRAYQILSYCLSGTSLGALLASLVVFLLSYACTEKEIVMGYWRLPFLLGLFALFSSRMLYRAFPEEMYETV